MNKELMKNIGFKKEVKNFEKGLCVFCSKVVNINDFKDSLSKKEYGISGMCQKCQDGVFSG